MKPYRLLPLALSVLLLLPGCRRTDVREMTVSMPDLVEADKAKIVYAEAKEDVAEAAVKAKAKIQELKDKKA